MAQDMTLLWGSGSPPCMRVMIVLEEKNLQGYNQKMLSFEKGDHKGPENMAMNPRGQLPSFKHGEHVLNESLAACMYLETQFKSQGNKLIPECPAEMAQMYQRMFEALTFSEKMASVIYYNWKVPEDERHDAAVKRNRDALVTEIKLWEGYLSKCGTKCCFVAGKCFTMADVVVFPAVAYLFRFGLCEKKYSALAKYCNCVKERASVKAAWPPTWNGPQTWGVDMLKDL